MPRFSVIWKSASSFSGDETSGLVRFQWLGCVRSKGTPATFAGRAPPSVPPRSWGVDDTPASS